MPVAATQKMTICPYPFCNARVWLGRPFLTRAAVIVAEGKRVRMEGGVRRSAGHVRWLRFADARCERSA
jgi:hypothetical protein